MTELTLPTSLVRLMLSDCDIVDIGQYIVSFSKAILKKLVLALAESRTHSGTCLNLESQRVITLTV
jgi:hypothetical protein